MPDIKVIPSTNTLLQTDPPPTDNSTSIAAPPIQPTTPVVPPPVKPVEFYPGYNAELTKYGQSVEENKKQLQTFTERRQTQNLMLRSSALLNSGAEGISPDWKQKQDAALAKQQELFNNYKQDMGDSLQTVHTDEWKYMIMNTLPTLMLSNGYKGAGIQSIDDVLKMIPNNNLTPSDAQWLQDTYSKMEYLKPTLPKQYGNTIGEVQQNLLSSMQQKKKLPIISVSGKTVEELAKYYAEPEQTKIEGLSSEDVRHLISYMELPDNEKTKIDDFITANVVAWKVESQYINMVKDEIINAKDESILGVDFTKMMMIQPMAATTAALDKIWNLTTRPTIAGAVIAMQSALYPNMQTADKKLHDLFDKYHNSGDNTWIALGKAYNDWDIPGVEKFILETVIDPVSYIGLGVMGRVADDLGITVMRVVGKGDMITMPSTASRSMATKFGSMVDSFDKGIANAGDATFKWFFARPGQVALEAGVDISKGAFSLATAPIKGGFWLLGKTTGAGTGYEIPRTVTQMARNWSRSSMAKFSACLYRMNPNILSLTNLTVSEIKDAASTVIKEFYDHPKEGTSMFGNTGANLAEFRYLQNAEITDFIKHISPNFAIDVPFRAHFNEQLINVIDKSLTTDQAAGNILTKLGIITDADNIAEMSAKLSEFRENIFKQANDRIIGKDAKSMMINMYEGIEKIRYENLADPISQHMEQAGRSVSWVSQMADKILQSANLVNFERKLVQPFARWQLLFANFGPANFFENMQRSWLGGAELMIPVDYTGTYEFRLMASDLMSFPWEAEVVSRLEQAIVDIKTNNTSIFKNGNIPLVTKPIFDKANNPIAWTINIRGEQFKVSSLADYNGIWEYMTNLQRSYDQQVHFINQLYKIAPDYMKQIDDIIERNRTLLKDIPVFGADDIAGAERLAQAAMIGGWEKLKALENITLPILTRRKINKDLAHMMSKFTSIPDNIKKSISYGLIEGTLFKDSAGISAAKEATINALREQSIVSLKPQIDKIQAAADQFATHAPKTSIEFQQDMSNLSGLIGGINDSMIKFRGDTELRAQNLMGVEKDSFELGSGRVMSEYLDAVQTHVEKMLKQMDSNSIITDVSGKSLLTPAQALAAKDTTTVYRKQLSNMLATRKALNELYAEIRNTSAKNRDNNFWAKWTPKKNSVWDKSIADYYKSFDNELDAKRLVESSFGQPTYVPDYVPKVDDGELTVSHLAYLFGATGDDIYRGMTHMMDQITLRPEDSFVVYVRNQAKAFAAKTNTTADALFFTEANVRKLYKEMLENMGLNSKAVTVDALAMQQIDQTFNEIDRLYKGTNITEGDVTKYKGYINSMAEDLKNQTISTDGKFRNIKEQSMINAREQHALAYPTYDDNNIIDESMKAVFPFWNYELFRYRWLPRTFMRTPGTLTGLARYQDYTNGGYVPVPFTDMQINPFRGSIWMGGLRSMYLKDQPEYYDQFKGLELMESIGRYGFYPGFPVQIPMILFGQAGGTAPQWSDLAPPWISTPLSALRALSPQHLGKIIDIIYPDRFRDYQTMLTLGKWGYDADYIWKQKQAGNKLTPEEDKLWLKAEADANGLRAIVMQQTGLLRYRPKSYEDEKELWKLAIQDATGVSVQKQNDIDKQYPTTGKRFADYYPLDAYQRKILYSYEIFRNWQGVSQSLTPSSYTQIEQKISSYYDEMQKLDNDYHHKGIFDSNGNRSSYSIEDLNRQRVEGKISASQWISRRNDMVQKLAEAKRVIGNSNIYKDVPKSLDDRLSYMQERGNPLPTLTPDQELINYYYDLMPKPAFNYETGMDELDFDTYFAHVDNLLSSLDPHFRDRLTSTIQSNWTGLEKLYWNASREYIRPYNRVKDLVISQYDEKSQYWLKRYAQADTAERAQIASYTLPDGNKLMSDFNTKLKASHEALRVADPTLDAWLNFFGKASSFSTKESEQIFNNLNKQYLNESIIK